MGSPQLPTCGLSNCDEAAPGRFASADLGCTTLLWFQQGSGFNC